MFVSVVFLSCLLIYIKETVSKSLLAQFEKNGTANVDYFKRTCKTKTYRHKLIIAF